LASLVCCGCRKRAETSGPSIEFTAIPEGREGGPEAITKIAGRVKGALPGDSIVLFARSGQWWVQPFAASPLTPIERDSTWSNSTHFGFEYAALLVRPEYRPPPMMTSLPKSGGLIRVVAKIQGSPATASVVKTIHFSGYDWKVRSAASNRGGGVSLFDTQNAWTDESGRLHLRIKMNSGRWNCAEVNLSRSLGYGTYRFTARDTSFLEPAVVLSVYTWDDSDADQNHREFGVELGRWGDPSNKNAQFVVQPYYVPANVTRFVTAAGPVTYALQWGPGQISFKATEGNGSPEHRVIAKHTFTAGVPTPGNEAIHVSFYIFTSSPVALKNEMEAVIDKFEYLP
jgi:hypothetical protein